MTASPLSPEDIQTLKDITQVHLNSGIPRDWAGWVDTCSDDIMLLPPGGERVVGKEATLAYLDTFPTTLEFAGEPTVIRGSGDMAFTVGEAQGKFEIEGEVVDVRMKWAAIYERQADGEWKMVLDAWNDSPL